MFLNQIPSKNGRIFLSICESRREGKKTKRVTVKALGYLDELEKEHDDPVAYFKAEAKRMSAQKKEAQRNSCELRSEHFSFTKRYDKNSEEETLQCENHLRSLGYIPMLAVFSELGLDSFLDNRRRYTKAEYNHTAIWKMLVIGRALKPESKLATWRYRDEIPEKMDFSDDDVYQSLAFFARYKEDMIQHVNEKLVKHGYRDDDNLMFYDVTNYYWEIDDNDEDVEFESGEIISGLRKRGCCKEHRPEPIVQMGLMMDAGGIPCDYSLFEGNRNDVATLRPMVDQLKQVHGKEHVIYVADKGMMSGDNIASLILGHNGFVISRSVRNCSKALESFVLDPEGYVRMPVDNDRKRKKDKDGNGYFLIKEKTEPTPIQVTDAIGRKHTVSINLRIIAFFSRKYQMRARKERQAAIEKAMRNASVKKKDAALNTYGSNKYLKKTIFDGQDEVENPGFVFSLDEDAIRKDEALDGYYLIFTNVAGTDENHTQQEMFFSKRENSLLLPRPVSAADIVKMYRQLWKIEDCFRITKSFLKARPVYVNTKDSIEAHFLSCYMALVILKVLEKKTKGHIEISRMIEELRKAKLFVDDDSGWWHQVYSSNIIEDIGRALNLDLTRKRYTKLDVRKLVAVAKH